MPNRPPRPAHPRTDRNLCGGLTVLLPLLLLASLGVRASGTAVPLKNLLQSIARSGVQLIYSSETVPADLEATPPPPDLPVEQRLKLLLAPFHLEAQRLPSGGYVIVPAVEATTALDLTVTIEHDGVSTPLAAAEVTLVEARRHALTDPMGRVAFAGLGAGNYAVEVRSDGLPVAHRSARLSSRHARTHLDIRIPWQAKSLEEVTVESSRYDAGATLGVLVTRESLASSPTTGSDAARTLQMLPGAAVAGYSAKTHVRGSRDDETLFRYDGVTLTDPFHLEALQSLYSGIDPAVIDSATSWTGQAPIRFGGRIGGVVDIEPRAIAGRTVDASVSNRDMSLLLGTPYDDARGSLFGAVRLSNALSPARWLEPDGVTPEYRDYVLRATWSAGPRLRLAAGLFAIDDQRDTVNSEAVPFDQHARLVDHERNAWLRMLWDILPAVHSETLLSGERYSDLVSGSVDSPGIEMGFLDKQQRHSALTLREELTLQPAPRWSSLLGVEMTDATLTDLLSSQATFNPTFVPALQPMASIQVASDLSLRAVARSFYGDLRWQAAEATLADIGVRYDSRHFDTLNRAEGHWSVRANLRQRLGTGTLLRLAWGQETQAGLYDFTRFPAGTVQPAPARLLNQLNVGVEQTFGHHWFLRTEIYDKRERSPFQTSEDLFTPFALLPEIALGSQPLLTQGARMRGFESQLESDRSRALSGWLSYAWSSAEDRIAGQWVPRSWDQPNAAQLGVRWLQGPWELTGLFSWHSGWPYTPLLIASTAAPDPSLVGVQLGPRNSARLENFLSLDLRLGWERSLGSGILQVSLELDDLTNSKTVCCRSYSLAQGPNGSSLLVDTPGYWLGFAPLLRLRWHR